MAPADQPTRRAFHALATSPDLAKFRDWLVIERERIRDALEMAPDAQVISALQGEARALKGIQTLMDVSCRG